MAKIWAAAASSRSFPQTKNPRAMDHGNPTGSRKEITVGERARGERTNVGHLRVGGDRIKVAVCGVAKDPEERGVHPGLGGRGVKDLKNPQRGC